jgi:hypothetical protein
MKFCEEQDKQPNGAKRHPRAGAWRDALDATEQLSLEDSFTIRPCSDYCKASIMESTAPVAIGASPAQLPRAPSKFPPPPAV